MNIKIFYLALIIFCLSIYSNGQTASALRNQIAEKASISIDVLTKSENKDIDNAEEINKITVSVVFKNTYCGGAAPSQSILEQYKTEYPLKNSIILLRDTSGNDKPVKVRTNSNGLIKIKLRP